MASGKPIGVRLILVGLALGPAFNAAAQRGGPGNSLPLPTTLEDFKQPGSQPISSLPFLPDIPTVDPIVPPSGCINCHGTEEFPVGLPAPSDAGATILNAWQGSMMAHASRDPLFEACLAISEQDAPGSGDLCLRCHVPTAWLAGRSKPTSGSAILESDRSGVNCNFCHRMVNPLFVDGQSPDDDLSILVSLARRGLQPRDYGNGMYVIDPRGGNPFLGEGAVLRGAREDVQPGHGVIISPFHRESAFCGTCHDVSNPAYEYNPRSGSFVPNAFNQRADDFSPGHLMPIERTYSEWKYSAFNTLAGVDIPNRGRVSTCQDCHMRKGPGKLCNQIAGQRDDAAMHDLTGGNTWVPQLLPRILASDSVIRAGIRRARATLRSAATLTAEQVRDSLQARVINNTGHKLPTGYPEGRRMWLFVGFLDPDGRFIRGSGIYNGATAELIHDEEIKVYETELGVGPAVSALTRIPAGKSFHFVVNNRVIKDNRIPPRGFRNDTFASFHGAPVGYHYDDGQYWDDSFYRIPPGARSAIVTLFYQTASKEYIEFLRDENHTNDAGRRLYDLWRQNKSPPETMASTVLAVVSQSHIFVDAQATGRNDGTTWLDAFTDLQDALDYAAGNAGVEEIRIARGTYAPDRGTGDRSATFSVRGGLALRGGFRHLSIRELLPPGGLQPDPAAFPTFLTGDLEGDDLFSRTGDTLDNSRHVVTVAGGGIVDAPARLTGLTILAGNANDTGVSGRALVFLGEGAGLLVDGGDVIATDCTFERNAANLRGGAIAVINQGSLVLNRCLIQRNRAPRGGGVYSQGGSPNLIACTLTRNEAFADVGGAVYCEDADGPKLISSLFTDNHARGPGGAVAIDRGPNAGLGRGSSTPAMINCTLTGNTSDGLVAGAFFDGGFSRPIVSNCILWDNRAARGTAPSTQAFGGDTGLNIRYSCIQDSDPNDSTIVPGLRNIDDNPQFINAAGGDLRLSSISPCINAGENSRVPADVTDVDGDGNTREPLPFDLDGNRRVADQTVDMGAYEFAIALPMLVRIMDGLGPAPDTFISPLGESCPLATFSLEANEPLTLVAVNATYTGTGPVPVATLVGRGDGLHAVTLDPPPEPGQWLRLDLGVTGTGNGSAILTVWVAHQPLDFNQDSRTTLADATAFGRAFSRNTGGDLIDVNCDSVIDIRDASAFGANWNDGWANTNLPPKP